MSGNNFLRFCSHIRVQSSHERLFNLLSLQFRSYMLFNLFIFVVGGTNVNCRHHEVCLLVGIPYWHYLFPTSKSDVANFLELIEVGLAIFLTQFDLTRYDLVILFCLHFTPSLGKSVSTQKSPSVCCLVLLLDAPLSTILI